MTKDELEIENLAKAFFQDKDRSRDKESQLIEAILNKKDFIMKIINKAARNYQNAVSSLRELKHEAIEITFDSAKRNYNLEKGAFVNYFSRNLRFYTEKILKDIQKNQEELILDAPKTDDEDSGALIDDIESNLDSNLDSIYISEKNQILTTILKSLNRLYLENRHSSNNKSKVYSYIVLNCLLEKPEKEFYTLINKYDFLKFQKELLKTIMDNFLKTREIPNQGEYSKMAGISETKFSDLKGIALDFLRNDKEMQEIS